MLRPGLVVIAPGGSHLVVRRKGNAPATCELSDAPPVLSVKPAANIMFLSVADEFGDRADESCACFTVSLPETSCGNAH